MKGTTIRNIVAAYYQVDLKKKTRAYEVSHPRQVMMYLCRKYTGLSKGQIVKLVGLKDPTTCLHAYRAILKRLEEDGELEEDIKAIEARL